MEQYNWNLEKVTSVDRVPYVIPQEDPEYAVFSILATRSGPAAIKKDADVQGSICITNSGRDKTQSLRIFDRIEVFEGGQWLGVTNWVLMPGVPFQKVPSSLSDPRSVISQGITWETSPVTPNDSHCATATFFGC
jgi:hypothetical protein